MAFALGTAALTGGDSRVREWSEVVAFSEDGGSGRERTECSISEQRCFFWLSSGLSLSPGDGNGGRSGRP